MWWNCLRGCALWVAWANCFVGAFAPSTMQRVHQRKMRASAGTEDAKSILADLGFLTEPPKKTKKRAGTEFLDRRSQLKPAQVIAFLQDGHVAQRNLFSAAEMGQLVPPLTQAFEELELEALRQKVAVFFGEEALETLPDADAMRLQLALLPPDRIPFLQVFNMFRSGAAAAESVRRLVTSKRLAAVASQLLGCERVRVYQDSIFVKRPGDGATQWHSDLRMAPFDSNDFVTLWLPLTDVPAVEEGGTGLVFASASHRDFSLNFWHDPHAGKDLSERYDEVSHGAMQLGDCTWHHGWVLHCAPGNELPETRVAFTVSFFADGARLLGDDAVQKPDSEDAWSVKDWIDDLAPGDVAAHELLPLVHGNEENDG